MKSGSFVIPLLLFGFLYVAVILPQSRRRKQAAALQRAVEPGSQVMLTSGLFATVVEIDDDTVIVQAAPGVELRYAKAAVLRVLPDPTEIDQPDADLDSADLDSTAKAETDDHDGGNDGESGPVSPS
ncbi:MAG TPA: preprotein translocase subunit YajC [Acidothermaceae bacterium]